MKRSSTLFIGTAAGLAATAWLAVQTQPAHAKSAPAVKQVHVAVAPVTAAQLAGKIKLAPGFKVTYLKKGAKYGKHFAKKAGRAIASGSTLPPLNLNSQHYKDAGGKPSTGRSGKAQIIARALMNKDTTTNLDVTTGSLDSMSTAPGTIAKLQLKTFYQSGDVAYTRNWNDLSGGGSVSYTLSDLHRHQSLQVQTNVRGIDPRTDVVTQKATVFLRPDLRANDLRVPAKAYVNTAVNIATLVSETNGDVGASADCVLYINGSAVDKAQGVYVDAGGDVSCVFTNTFTATGTYKLAVKVENVNPGDYDTSNNEADGSIEIVQPTVALNYYFNASQYEQHDKYQSSYSYRQSDGTYAEGTDALYNYSYSYLWQYVGFGGWTNKATVNFPVTFTSKETSDSTDLVTENATIPASWSYNYSDGTYTYSGGCAEQWDSATYVWMYVCSQKVADSSGNAVSSFSNVYYNRYGGDVAYHSSQYDHYWNQYTGTDSYYTWNTDSDSQAGIAKPWGSNLAFTVSATDGTTTLTASPSGSLQSTTYWSNVYPLTCTEYTSDTWTEKSCSSDDAGSTGKSISVSDLSS